MAIETSYSMAIEIKESDRMLSWLADSDLDVTTWSEYTYHRMTVADGVSDQSVNLGGCASGDVVFIKTDQTITFKINGDDLAITCTDFAVLTAGITALTISNASGDDAVVEILVLD